MKKEEPTAQAVPHPQHTVVMPSRSVPPTHGVPSTIGGDSYQPPSVLGTVLGNGPASVAPSTQREQIVPGSASSASILAEIRKGPADRLQIEIRAASGGMGAIDVFVDRALDRRIAVKTLHPHLRSDDAAVRMFLREARLTGLLDHPHIVPVYDVGERDQESLYFSMKLVDGQTLSALIRALPRGPLDSATLYALLEIIIKVCDALAFAHSRGVIHCDIKASNVMVGEFGQVYLMDWGIARLVASEVEPGSVPDFSKAPVPPLRPSATDNSVIGTPCYMSPEQARGDRGTLDARSDVFLLGAMLYEILTRRPPYATKDRNETLALAAAGTFPPPRRVAGEVAVAPELDRIVMRAMAKNPADRYPSISALREDVVRFMRGGGEFPRRTFKAGSFILREGEEGDAAYIVVSGKCEIRKDLPGGPEVLQTVGPGAVFGEMAILDAGPRTASVVAVEDTDVLVVTSTVLEQELAALKPWMATLMKSLAARFRNIDAAHRATYVGSNANTTSPTRLANQVLMQVLTWGTEGPNGERSMSWRTLGRELEAQLGAPPLAIFGVAARYGLRLDIEKDLFTIPDPKTLTERLKADLAREG